MRFVNLNDDQQRTTCYDRVLILGGGPNFVLNRFEDFKAMIKEQGMKFWFRFWLNFSLSPETIQDPQSVTPHMTNVMSVLCNSIHKNFLEGSPRDTIIYCFDTFTLMTDNDSKEKKVGAWKRVKAENKFKQEAKRIEQEGKESLTAYLQFHFGCALCEVFYKWLEANQVGSRSYYWLLPEIYSTPDFQPRLIENYIVNVWGVRVLKLLGVKKDTCPWLNLMLSERKKNLMGEEEFSLKESQKELECWKKKFQDMKVTLLKFDENKDEPNCDETIADGSPVKTNKKTKTQIEKTTPHCAFCFSTESFITKLKKCSLCVIENKEIPKYYCGVSCQTEDWYRHHAKEHFTFMPYLQVQSNAIELSAENESKQLTLSLFDNPDTCE